MDSLPWLENALAAAAPGAATLVTGEGGDGRALLAGGLAAKFNGGAEEGADLMKIAPPPDKTQIPVEAVREILAFFALAPVRGEFRVALIEPADALNNAAANMLLKTLEEPNARRCLVLSAKTARQLPATIVSRCRVVAAPRPTAAEARAWLRGRGGDDAAARLAFCGGRPLAALETPGAWPAQVAEVLAAGGRLDVAAAAALFSKNAPGGDWLDGAQKWSADIARAACGLEARFFPSSAGVLENLAGGRRKAWLDFQADLARRRALFSHPLAKDLFLHETLYDYRQLCAAG